MSSIVTIAAKSRPPASPLVAQPTTESRVVVSEDSDSIGHAEGSTSDTDCARGCERSEPVEIPTRFLRSRYAVCSDGRLDYQYNDLEVTILADRVGKLALHLRYSCPRDAPGDHLGGIDLPVPQQGVKNFRDCIRRSMPMGAIFRRIDLEADTLGPRESEPSIYERKVQGCQLGLGFRVQAHSLAFLGRNCTCYRFQSPASGTTRMMRDG